MLPLLIARPVSPEKYRGGSKRPLFEVVAAGPYMGVLPEPGFQSDLMSAPDYARSWFDHDWDTPSIIHDRACQNPNLSHARANYIFRCALKDAGVGFLARWLVWAYVSRPGAPRVDWPQPNVIGWVDGRQ